MWFHEYTKLFICVGFLMWRLQPRMFLLSFPHVDPFPQNSYDSLIKSLFIFQDLTQIPLSP